jgi:putative drug exporter of the RND superfamily
MTPELRALAFPLMTRLLQRLGAWCAAHPLVVIAVWVAVAGATAGLAATAGGQLSRGESLPGTEVQAADQLLAAHDPLAGDTSAEVLLHADDARAVRAAVPRVQDAVRRLPRVVDATVGVTRVAPDGRTVVVHVGYDAPRFTLHGSDLAALERAADTAQGSGVDGYVTGDLFTQLYQPSSGTGEKVGIAIALLVLLFAFGSVIAALMPVATAALAIVTGLSLVHLLANVYSVNDSAPALATMLGLGAGIDYALFIVTRHREGMRHGLAPAQAAAAATASAGSSVVWAGVTVVAAICGLAFGGIPVVTSLGVSAAVVVAVSVVSALTILPALLSLTDTHIDRLHLPLPHLRAERVGTALDPSLPAAASWWGSWARRIERTPVRYVVGAAALLVVLAIPVSAMRLGMPDSSAAVRGSDARTAYELTARGFGPGANAPLTLVATIPATVRPDALGTALARAVGSDPDVAGAGRLRVSPDGRVGVMSVQPRSGPQSAATADLVPRLRHDVVPAVERRLHVSVLVSGLPAGRYDIGQRVLHRLPWFVGAVLAVSFLLLMLVFRSVLVPVKAVLLNLLSIAAALGVIVAVFTWGWLHRLVGVVEPVPVVDVVPMMMFAIVFGLSMDYEVFLLSRVREEWLIGGDGRGSVVRGLTSTARVITAAAAIMVSVFLAFTLSSDVIVKMVGLGLAVAVFLDATVIRLVLVPATMSLLGDLNWWLPAWLDRWLPHVDVNAAVPVAPTAFPAGRAQETEAPMARPTP